jgi:DNA helicase-2/ATP-dependent DNA helicase PcrA
MINYDTDLNPAQREAAFHKGGPLLVIAGAGSGKTRTIVYRLARLVEEDVDPRNILLLTFTRKAAQEMLHRAQELLGHGQPRMGQTLGGTFHGFAYMALRQSADKLGLAGGFSVLDRSDSLDLVGQAKTDLDLGKGDRSFPKKATVYEMISKSRNKELDIPRVVQAEATHLFPYAEDMEKMAARYAELKQGYGLLDYDDLLFRLERMLVDHPEELERWQRRCGYVMVDEFQDTNLVQARLVKLLAGEERNVMAVGDDAQSIYGFRGANVENILRFPQDYVGARIIRLEQNYRSTQPILDLTNAILEGAYRKFDKHLFTEKTDGPTPELIRTLSDTSQARVVLDKVMELGRKYPLHEIAVLFRAGYQSFALEAALSKISITFQKYGGIRFIEAAHIKDVISLMRLAVNAHDLPSWKRALSHIKGVGPKTAQKIVDALIAGDQKKLGNYKKKHGELADMLALLDRLRAGDTKPAHVLEEVMSYYLPVLVREYADDYPRRQQGLEQFAKIAAGYDALEEFLADMSLDPPDEEAGKARPQDSLVLSTIHSAKGLEWSAVIVLDLVEDRFPTRKAMQRPEDMEEERRLLYVACTRAREYLGMMVPESIYVRRMERSDPVRPSPFVEELPRESYRSLREAYSGGLQEDASALRKRASQSQAVFEDAGPTESHAVDPTKLGFCKHKIFGRGKIIAHVPPDKYKINFPGFGIKVIVGRFLEMEES